VGVNGPFGICRLLSVPARSSLKFQRSPFAVYLTPESAPTASRVQGSLVDRRACATWIAAGTRLVAIGARAALRSGSVLLLRLECRLCPNPIAIVSRECTDATTFVPLAR
jgi:hypothetical protein